MTPWPFEPEDAEEAGEIRAELERAGTPIGPHDVLIAAQARRRSALLVTANTTEFIRVPRLRIADWSNRSEGPQATCYRHGIRLFELLPVTMPFVRRRTL